MNKVDWRYGKVVVLKGNTKNVVSRFYKGYGEASLKGPWENGGKYLNLDLSDKDTYVLGPKSVLEKYAGNINGKKQPNLVYIEDLTKEQFKFFKCHYAVKGATASLHSSSSQD